MIFRLGSPCCTAPGGMGVAADDDAAGGWAAGFGAADELAPADSWTSCGAPPAPASPPAAGRTPALRLLSNEADSGAGLAPHPVAINIAHPQTHQRRTGHCFIPAPISIPYSVRSALSGFMLAARSAGYTPDSTPMIVANSSAKSTSHSGVTTVDDVVASGEPMLAWVCWAVK